MIAEKAANPAQPNAIACGPAARDTRDAQRVQLGGEYEMCHMIQVALMGPVRTVVSQDATSNAATYDGVPSVVAPARPFDKAFRAGEDGADHHKILPPRFTLRAHVFHPAAKLLLEGKSCLCVCLRAGTERHEERTQRHAHEATHPSSHERVHSAVLPESLAGVVGRR